MQKAVKLIKASAGSGKTYTLTKEYLKLLLDGNDEQSYKHILAVTFTNKATEEMKSRIIESLHDLASDTLNADSEKARVRLVKILNDYNCFSISTIDKFFQMVMRSFAREIGKYASYKVELDTDSVVAQAVDMLLDTLQEPENGDLLEWLKDYSFKRVEEGERWNITGSLASMAKLFFKEDFKLKLKEAETIISDKSQIREFGKELKTIVSEFTRSAEAIGRKGMKIMAEAGLEPEDFKYKRTGPFMIFKYLASGDIRPPQARIYECFGDHDFPEIHSAVDELTALFETRYGDYISALLIDKNLHLLGIYSDIYRHLNQYLKENNVVLLSEANDLLSRIIDGSDTPFVYEKIGVRYDHIMLDEAQDTSLLQWKNFMPLFNDNISSGKQNLVVGDIKQSIYRWRGSDWRLMNDYIFKDLGKENINDSEPLAENWRSCRNIVGFNKMVFSSVENRLNLGGVYDDCNQKVPSKHDDWEAGRVKVGFIEGKEWKDEAMLRMVKDINEMVEAGYRHEDITVLVRKNKEGEQVATFLMENGISVITDDSLHIGSSACVAALLDVLYYMVNPDDPVNVLLVGEHSGLAEDCANQGSLYEICQKILSGGKVVPQKGDIPFINAFLDCVIAYQEKYGSSVRGFLKWWDESGKNKNICAPEGQDAIRIMTIHKSKGLGLQAVIIPFLEEKFKGHNDPVWFRTSGRFSKLGLVPLVPSEQMEGSIFGEQYQKELIYSRIDSINTAYVAMTRPVSQLIVYSPAPSENGKKDCTSFSNLLFSILKEKLDEFGTFTFGELESFKSKVKTNQGLLQDQFYYMPAGERLHLSLRASEYFDCDISPRRRGMELHDMLSKVDTLEDLEMACRGDEESFKYLSGHIDKVSGYHWFDGTYRSANESSIVDRDGSVHRPDRILVDDSGKKAVIVDYKFGVRKSSYLEQIAIYASLLKEMGFADVEAFLWYVDKDIVEKLKDNEQ